MALGFTEIGRDLSNFAYCAVLSIPPGNVLCNHHNPGDSSHITAGTMGYLTSLISVKACLDGMILSA